MDCPTARERLLSADTAELRPGAQTALARHLDTCAGCRVSAQRILGDLPALELHYAAPPARAAVERTLERALEATRPRGRAASVRRAAFALPLAAAAALMVYLVGDGPLPMLWDDATSPPPADSLPPMPAPPAAPVVNAPADRAVAIFGTADPRITVVWYF
jgi:hypothetical protein